jgi:hypothetical protein
MDSAAYARFICAKAHVRHRLSAWASDPRLPNSLGNLNTPGQPEQIPVAVIRDTLSLCPDESPAPGTSELNFINDEELRTNLRNDIGTVTAALSNGEWKAATVLAGSTIEGLLLWSLSQSPATDIATAITNLVASGKLERRPHANLERWDLCEFNEVARNLGIIEDDTYTKANLAREYRNLIHPGRAQRLGQKCDRGTALSCVAALEHVVRDLT